MRYESIKLERKYQRYNRKNITTDLQIISIEQYGFCLKICEKKPKNEKLQMAILIYAHE